MANVVVDGAANLAQLAAIDLLTNGTLEYQLIADSSETFTQIATVISNSIKTFLVIIRRNSTRSDQ